MSVKTYSYKNQGNIYVGPHFQVKEFASFGNGKLYTDTVLIDDGLVNHLEKIFSKLNATKAIISSGYRNYDCDKAVGGSGVGQHVNGRAVDICYYDKNGAIIPSKIVICVAYDLGELNGIAKINNNYTHLDNRVGSVYRGDETRGNSSYWTNPYTYFGVTTSEVAKYTSSANTSQTNTSQTNNTKYINLPSGATSWRVYKTNVQPVKANACGTIKPSKFGGLSYKILANPMKDVYTIQTDSFGTVNIYGASSTGATITNTRTYKNGSN